MTTVRRIVVKFGADTKDYQNGLNKVMRSTDNAVRRIRGLFLPLASAFTARKLFSDYIRGADTVGKFADRIGESVQTVDAWSRAVQFAGGTAEGFRSSLETLNSNVQILAATNEGRAKRTFETLGIAIRNTNGDIRTGEELLLELADRIEGLDNATSAGLLRRLGLDASTITLLQQGRREVENTLKVTRRYAFRKQDAETARDFNDAILRVFFSIEAVSRITLRELVPRLTKAANKFSIFSDSLLQNERFVKILSGTITAFLIPAFARLLIAVSPLTALGLAIAGTALIIDDFLADLDGRDSAIGRIRNEFASLHPVLQILTFPLLQIVRLLKVIDEYSRFESIGQFWEDVGSWLLSPLEYLGTRDYALTGNAGREVQQLLNGPIGLPDSYRNRVNQNNQEQNVSVVNNFDQINVNAATVTQGVVDITREFKSRFTQSIDVARMAQNG